MLSTAAATNTADQLLAAPQTRVSAPDQGSTRVCLWPIADLAHGRSLRRINL